VLVTNPVRNHGSFSDTGFENFHKSSAPLEVGFGASIIVCFEVRTFELKQERALTNASMLIRNSYVCCFWLRVEMIV
jgi:hypothetical protein